EEAIFEVQGILLDLSLPPVLSRRQCVKLPQRVTWAKQTVQITGLGLPFFADTMNAVNGIHHSISRKYAASGLRPWRSTQLGDYISLDVGNRYITPNTFTNGESAIPFHPLVDPHGILLEATRDVGSHLADNEVRYFERLHNSSGIASFEDIDPAVFRPGQIVQLQVSFVTVPVAGAKGIYQVTPKLRSIAILDRSLQEVSNKH
ncbi:hypothetical protein DENSPDRAFT_789985, partial [Dentipellis sp. KUC8613]